MNANIVYEQNTMGDWDLIECWISDDLIPLSLTFITCKKPCSILCMETGN